jgi:L-rhamnose mutarotase
MHMGHINRDDLAHKIKACGARHYSVHAAKLLGGILEIA